MSVECDVSSWALHCALSHTACLCQLNVTMLVMCACLEVKHRETGEVMVVKQLLGFDRDAQENFLKEVT